MRRGPWPLQLPRACTVKGSTEQSPDSLAALHALIKNMHDHSNGGLRGSTAELR